MLLYIKICSIKYITSEFNLKLIIANSTGDFIIFVENISSCDSLSDLSLYFVNKKMIYAIRLHNRYDFRLCTRTWPKCANFPRSTILSEYFTLEKNGPLGPLQLRQLNQKIYFYSRMWRLHSYMVVA